jgi:N-ethylmaleimide reductase
MADADPHETHAALLNAVDGMGLAYVHLIHIPLDGQDALDLVHEHWSGPVIENGGMTLACANDLIARGRAAAVSFGYAFIANPDLVARFRSGASLAKASRANFYTGGEDDRKGYTDYPVWKPE